MTEDALDRGLLEAARSAGAHDEFIAFVAEYPGSPVAETLKTAMSLDALDEFPAFAGSFAGALWEHGVQKAGNPDTENGRRIRELFPEDRWPQWLQQQSAASSGMSDETPPKHENYDYSHTVDEAAAGHIEIEYTITGNEYEAEQLWLEIRQLLREHDERFGDRPDTSMEGSQ